MRKLDHCNIVRLRYFFYSSGDKVSWPSAPPRVLGLRLVSELSDGLCVMFNHNFRG